MPRELPVMSACFPFCAMAPPGRAVAAKDARRTPRCNYSGITCAVGRAADGNDEPVAFPVVLGLRRSAIVHPQLEARDLQVGWAEGIGVGGKDQWGQSHTKTPAVRSA